jgi:molybdenum cofactor cytidylyltransferase
VPSPSTPSGIKLGVVVLAAGASSRMGRPKMLLPWGSTSVIGHLIGQWRALHSEQIAVVCAAGDQAIHHELDRVGFSPGNRIVNRAPELGMFSSIQCAARWLGWREDVSHWAIILGDQPHLREESLRALIDFASARPQKICQPIRGGRRRHPVILPRLGFQRLRDAPEENLKNFLQSALQELEFCEMDDAGLDLDMDRPEDYERAIRLYSDSHK